MMWRVKQLADPDGILAPGVVLNRDPGVHLRNLKSTPEIEEVGDEVHRVRLLRAGLPEPQPHHDAAPADRDAPRDGAPAAPARRCSKRCSSSTSTTRSRPAPPTGPAARRARWRSTPASWSRSCAPDAHGPRERERARELARPATDAVERAARPRGSGPAATVRCAAASRACGSHERPHAPASAPAPRAAVRPRARGPRPCTCPSCVNRIFGNPRERARARPSLPEALVAISARAGLPLWIPDDVAGHCCGLPVELEGLSARTRADGPRTGSALARWTDDGELPVVIDASSCTHAARRRRRDSGGCEVIDSIAWVHDRLLERLEVSRKLASVGRAPDLLGAAPRSLGQAARRSPRGCSDDVVVPATAGCCGMAGDRGCCTRSCLRRRSATSPGSSRAARSTRACRATGPVRSRCSR